MSDEAVKNINHVAEIIHAALCKPQSGEKCPGLNQGHLRIPGRYDVLSPTPYHEAAVEVLDEVATWK